MAITKLNSNQLYRKCNPAKFDFNTTADLQERLSALGQDRALSVVKRILEQEAKNRKTPDDWAYVYNFDEPYKPMAISFPAGMACDFAKDVDELIEELSTTLPALVESDEYKAALSIIRQKYKSKKDEYISVLQRKAKGKRVSLLHMQMGLVVAPMKDGEVLSPDTFDQLPDEEKQLVMNDLNAMQEEIENATQDLPRWEERQKEEIDTLREKCVRAAVKKPIDDLRVKYRKHLQANKFLKSIQVHILENVDEFVPHESEKSSIGNEDDPLQTLLSKMKQPEEDKFSKLKVNVVVKNMPESGAPIITLDHPTQGNLVGKVERIQQYGALLTDFTLIKAGALHQANGGFLLLDARKVLEQPYAWDSLKRAIASKRIKIEAPSDETSFTTISLDPDPIPLDVKVVLTGDFEIYDFLCERDPDFRDFFQYGCCGSCVLLIVRPLLELLNMPHV